MANFMGLLTEIIYEDRNVSEEFAAFNFRVNSSPLRRIFRHCPLFEVYLIYTTFREFAVLPSSREWTSSV
jgi:hypothetical protein